MIRQRVAGLTLWSDNVSATPALYLYTPVTLTGIELRV